MILVFSSLPGRREKKKKSRDDGDSEASLRGCCRVLFGLKSGEKVCFFSLQKEEYGTLKAGFINS